MPLFRLFQADENNTHFHKAAVKINLDYCIVHTQTTLDDLYSFTVAQSLKYITISEHSPSTKKSSSKFLPGKTTILSFAAKQFFTKVGKARCILIPNSSTQYQVLYSATRIGILRHGIVPL